MIFETWVVYLFVLLQGASPFQGAGAVSLLRMLRLTRICRLVRVLRVVPELMVLIKGLRAAFKSVGWTLALLVIVIYIFAVCFRILCKENPLGATVFASIPDGMRFLLLPGLLPDSESHVMDMANE